MCSKLSHPPFALSRRKLVGHRWRRCPGWFACAGSRLVGAQALGRVESDYIQRVMSDCGGNVSQAASLLGIHRRSLQRKLAKNPVRETE
jgi:transcriptional regulator of acetoin/glycerol metabolism